VHGSITCKADGSVVTAEKRACCNGTQCSAVLPRSWHDKMLTNRAIGCRVGQREVAGPPCAVAATLPTFWLIPRAAAPVMAPAAMSTCISGLHAYCRQPVHVKANRAHVQQRASPTARAVADTDQLPSSSSSSAGQQQPDIGGAPNRLAAAGKRVATLAASKTAVLDVQEQGRPLGEEPLSLNAALHRRPACANLSRPCARSHPMLPASALALQLST
jgi:hypothetical protein